MFKRGKLVGWIIVWLICVVMCNLSAFSAESEMAEKESLSTKIVLVDVIGREVVLDKPATKVVGTHNPTLNVAIVLGGGEKYIGGFGNKEMSRGLCEAVMNDYDGIVQIGKGKNINFETVLATGAELAIIPERFKDQVEQFEKVDMNVIVALPNEESFDTIRQSLTLVGQALDATDRADMIIDFMDDRIEKAKNITSSVTAKKKVLFIGKKSPLSVAPSAMIQNQLIEVAGGENAVSGVEGLGGFVDVNIEQIIAWNPDVIWYPAYAIYPVEEIINDPGWKRTNAVKNNQVYKFPSLMEPWDYPTAAVSLGIAWATHNLHPELYTIDEIMADVNKYYDLVYEKTFTAEELGLK